MTICLSRQYGLSVDLMVIRVVRSIGVVFGLSFGILADKFDRAYGQWQLPPSLAVLLPFL